jgi:hypothetical protein
VWEKTEANRSTRLAITSRRSLLFIAFVKIQPPKKAGINDTMNDHVDIFFSFTKKWYRIQPLWGHTVLLEVDDESR